MLTDLAENELWEYRSAAAEPEDFDTFWQETLAEARRFPSAVSLRPVATGLRTLEHFDLTFAGYGGDPIRGWLVRPAGVVEPLPTVVQYIGYGGGRGAPLENLLWASAGFTHVVMDNRGQGSSHRPGSTDDPHGSGFSYPGFMTRGIGSAREHFFRRLFTDAVRAVDAVLELPGVDPDAIGVVGGSQGGALALATSVLHPRVRALACFVPFLCDIRRATLITDARPYREIAAFLETHRGDVEQVFATLAYLDQVNFARRGRVPAWFSTSLMDPVCPPSTVFGAYHEYPAAKQMTLWQYNGHIGGGVEDERMGLEFLRSHLTSAG